MPVTRESIVEAVRAATEPHEWVRAMYVAGSAAFGLVDRDGFTADVPADPAAWRARLRPRLDELKLRFEMTQIHPQKSAFRGDVAAAVVFYQSFTLRPLVEALRMKHDPWRYDFDVRY